MVYHQNGLRNCEDHVLDPSTKLAYISCDPGRDRWNTVMGNLRDPVWQTGDIYLYDYARHNPKKPGKIAPLDLAGFPVAYSKVFHPLGIAVDAKNRLLYVVNHGPPDPSIEIFRLTNGGRNATYVKTFTSPALNAPNSVAPLNAEEIIVSNDHYFTFEANKALHNVENYLGLPLPTVVHINTRTGISHNLARVPFANGVAVINSTHFAVASTSTQRIRIYTYSGSGESFALQGPVVVLKTRMWTDNLRVTSEGTLLCGGHPHAFEMVTIAKENQLYNLDGEHGDAGLLPEEGRPRAPGMVVEWDGNAEGKIKEVYVGTEFGATTTGSRDQGFGMISGLYEKGLLMYTV